ncbi:MAG: hypothetical protein R2769_09690 [Saprospiraceae bacterium]
MPAITIMMIRRDFADFLLDNLHGRIAVDMVRVSGPAFENVDNRLLCLWLVNMDFTEGNVWSRQTCLCMHPNFYTVKM